MKKKAPIKIDTATAIFTEPCATTAQKIACGHKHFAAMKACADWSNAPDVQKAGTELEAATTDMEASVALIAKLSGQIDAERTNLLLLARRWSGKKRACLTAITTYCDGSKDKVLAFGTGVLVIQPTPPAGVPTNLRDKHSKVFGVAMATWDAQHNKHDFMVQHATSPADAATYSAPIVVSKSTFKLPGQTPGATIHFRVLTIDPKLPTGQSEYTAWVPVMVGV